MRSIKAESVTIKLLISLYVGKVVSAEAQRS